MNKVPKGKAIYRGAKVYKEGQECPFLKDSPKKELNDNKKVSRDKKAN